MKSQKDWDGEGIRPVVAIAPSTQGSADYCDPSSASRTFLDIEFSQADMAT